MFWLETVMIYVQVLLAQIGLINHSINEAFSYNQYVGAEYAAEASIAKQLYAVKSEDIDSVGTMKTVAANIPTAMQEYDTINTKASTSYFDVAFANTLKDETDFGRVQGLDISAKDIDHKDWFNSVTIEYNKTDNENIELIVYQVTKSQTNNCLLDEFDAPGSCSSMKKIVVNTLDSATNGYMQDGFLFQVFSGDDGFSKKITVTGFNTDFSDYRVTVNTISGGKTDMRYRVYKNGVAVAITNNIVEIDTVGNAIDGFARLKIQKRISDEITPLAKYVLFSDSKVEK